MDNETKRAGVSIFVLVLFLVFSVTLLPQKAYATASKGPVQKLARGIAQIFASPFQLPKEIIQKTSDSNAPIYLVPVQGFFEGLGSGIYLGIRQMVSGFTDMFTFWTPLGRDWGPIYDPATLVPEI